VIEDASTSEVVHETRGDLSVSWGKWRGTMRPKAGGERVKFEGRFSDLSKRVAGRWVYVLDHASFPMPSGGPRSAKR
jgi:ketosteroid isomerase-like protein